MQQMLDVILANQAPKQKELREKYRKENERRERNLKRVHAEIISLESVA